MEHCYFLAYLHAECFKLEWLTCQYDDVIGGWQNWRYRPSRPSSISMPTSRVGFVQCLVRVFLHVFEIVDLVLNDPFTLYQLHLNISKSALCLPGAPWLQRVSDTPFVTYQNWNRGSYPVCFTFTSRERRSVSRSHRWSTRGRTILSHVFGGNGLPSTYSPLSQKLKK